MYVPRLIETIVVVILFVAVFDSEQLKRELNDPKQIARI